MPPTFAASAREPAVSPEDAFKALTGYPPMLWQSRLLADFIAGRMPDALDIPTGLGKTAVMTIWLIARAFGAAVPRRLIYVVDRRVVVDQASDVAARLRDRLDVDTHVGPALRSGLKVGRIGRDAAGKDNGGGLVISTLRGGLAASRDWHQDPAAPAIVVGTVDMIGSRLLFSGYGVSRGMRPVHAALLAADSLIVLDEAHLVPPFEALVDAVGAFAAEDAGRTNLPAAPLKLLSFSATGRSDKPATFRLTAEEQGEPLAAARLGAAKRLAIHPIVPAADLPARLAALAIERAGEDAAVTVYCDSRKTAQAVAEALGKSLPKGDQTPRIALLVGERRVRERQKLAESDVDLRFQPRGSEAHGRSKLTGPAYLVATSAGEVGADLDADHMVCDLVAWERMVQRLGRVNRRAEPGVALIDVFPALTDKEAEQPIDTIDRLTRLRAPFEARGAWTVHDDGRLDASPGALARVKAAVNPAVIEAASTEEPLRPALTRAHVDAWAMTSLETHHGRPLVAPWLRGWVDDKPQNRVVWRALLPLPGDLKPEKGVLDLSRGQKAKLQEFLEHAGPHLTETLEAPTYRVVDVLRKRALAWSKVKRSTPTRPPWLVIVGDRPGELDIIHLVERLADKRFDLERAIVGRTVIVDARLGGLHDDGLLDTGAEGPPLTLDATANGAVDREGWGDDLAKAAGFRIVPSDRQEDDWPEVFLWSEDPDAETPDLVVEVWRGTGAGGERPSIARHAQGLAEHLAWTGEDAAKLATALGLGPDYTAMLVAAARVHDLGKARREWQDAVGAPGKDRPFAKTKGGGFSGGLDGYRHEFGSLVDGAEALAALDGLADLARHLVAAHHGHARPTIPAVDPGRPPSASAELAREVALRYARLQSAWGPWGLAWWESVLRAADWSASRDLNEHGPKARADG